MGVADRVLLQLEQIAKVGQRKVFLKIAIGFIKQIVPLIFSSHRTIINAFLIFRTSIVFLKIAISFTQIASQSFYTHGKIINSFSIFRASTVFMKLTNSFIT